MAYLCIVFVHIVLQDDDYEWMVKSYPVIKDVTGVKMCMSENACFERFEIFYSTQPFGPSVLDKTYWKQVEPKVSVHHVSLKYIVPTLLSFQPL